MAAVPADRPVAMELSGASFDANAPANPFLAPASSVAALFTTGPTLALVALIFEATSSLMNLPVAEWCASMPKAAFFALFDSSSTVRAFVFESRKESSF